MVGACVIAKLLMVPNPAPARSPWSWVEDANTLGDSVVIS